MSALPLVLVFILVEVALVELTVLELQLVMCQLAFNF
jgi:hypothetical protein